MSFPDSGCVIVSVWIYKQGVCASVSKENHTDNSCFVCVLMSHGEEGTILGSDERWLAVKTLTSLMTSDLCPSLQDKPKLFFLQVAVTCKTHRAFHNILSIVWLFVVVLITYSGLQGDGIWPWCWGRQCRSTGGIFWNIWRSRGRFSLLLFYSGRFALHLHRCSIGGFTEFLYSMCTRVFKNIFISQQGTTLGEIQKKALYLSMNFARCWRNVI